jgi:hypothetical protein
MKDTGKEFQEWSEPYMKPLSEPKANWEEEFVEKGADLEHERWAKWQRYVHTKCVPSADDGIWQIGYEFIERWERQINTPYAELSESEKESDREQVRPYLPLIKSLLAQQRKEIVREIEKLKQDPEKNEYMKFAQMLDGGEALRFHSKTHNQALDQAIKAVSEDN